MLNKRGFFSDYSLLNEDESDINVAGQFQGAYNAHKQNEEAIAANTRRIDDLTNRTERAFNQAATDVAMRDFYTPPNKFDPELWDKVKKQGDYASASLQNSDTLEQQRLANAQANQSRYLSDIRDKIEMERRTKEATRSQNNKLQQLSNYNNFLNQTSDTDHLSVSDLADVRKKIAQERQEAANKAGIGTVGDFRRSENAPAQAKFKVQHDADVAEHNRRASAQADFDLSYLNKSVTNIDNMTPDQKAAYNRLPPDQKDLFNRELQQKISNAEIGNTLQQVGSAIGGLDGERAKLAIQNWWQYNPHSGVQLTAGIIGTILVGAGLYTAAKKWREYRARKKAMEAA